MVFKSLIINITICILNTVENEILIIIYILRLTQELISVDQYNFMSAQFHNASVIKGVKSNLFLEIIL